MENEIQTKTAEELGLILAQSYEQILTSQSNIRNIIQELDARMKRRAEVAKEITDAP
jgi:hypothetical protein